MWRSSRTKRIRRSCACEPCSTSAPERVHHGDHGDHGGDLGATSGAAVRGLRAGTPSLLLSPCPPCSPWRILQQAYALPMPVEFKHARLSNGLTAIAEVIPEAHTTAIGFFVKTGARDEDSRLMGV